MDQENYEKILEYLKTTHSGANAMRDPEVALRLERAIVAFEADLEENIFSEEFLRHYLTN